MLEATARTNIQWNVIKRKSNLSWYGHVTTIQTGALTVYQSERTDEMNHEFTRELVRQGQAMAKESAERELDARVIMNSKGDLTGEMATLSALATAGLLPHVEADLSSRGLIGEPKKSISGKNALALVPTIKSQK